MKRCLSLLLAFLICINIIGVSALAAEEKEIQVQIPCQYTVWFDIKEGNVTGYLIDGGVYVSASTIAMLTGYNDYQDGSIVTFMKGDSTSSFFYRIDLVNGKIIRHAMLTQTEWKVDIKKLSNGSYAMNLEEVLLAMNVQISFSDDEEYLLCTYLPYTVYDAWLAFQKSNASLFSWDEIVEDQGDIDPQEVGILSAVNSLYIDYNDHFISDAFLAWWTDDVLTATEDQYMDAMTEILLCMAEDRNGFLSDDDIYTTYKHDNKVVGLTAKLLNLLNVDEEISYITKALKKGSSIADKGIDVLDTVNILSQYQSIQETQRDMLRELFVSFPMYAQAENAASKSVYNAANHLSLRIEEGAVGTTATVCDTVVDLMVGELEGTISAATPALAIVKAMATIIKITPGLSDLADANKHINVGCDTWALLMLSIHNYNYWADNFYSYDFPTENNMNQLKLTMLFRIMASITARQQFVKSGTLQESTVSVMNSKNKDLTKLYFLIEGSKPKTAPVNNSPTISWNSYLDKISPSNTTSHDPENTPTSGEKPDLTDALSDAVEFNGHYYKFYDESLTWQEAKDACEQAGGHLVTITDQGEQGFISGYIQGAAKRSYWIGLSDEAENDNWTWVTGEPFSYSNWARNEPNHGYGGSEHYVAIVSYDTFYNYEVLFGQWNDHVNNDVELYQFGYICEWENGTSLPNDKPSQEPEHTGADSALKKYIEAANKTTATGSWTEDMTMEAQMLLKDGSSTVNAKVNMDSSVDISGWNGSDTSSLYMSGWANMSVLDQEIAYTMTWKNGMAHYKYTKPTVTETDMKVDPAFFNIHSLTEDMIVSSSVSGSQIELTVKGDELTRIGIATAGEMLQGVTNLSYSDADVRVSVSSDTGAIDTIVMTFSASMNMQGYDVKADYTIEYNFSSNDQLASDKYQSFLADKGYLSDWNELGVSSNYKAQEYSLIDINQDGIDELIILDNSHHGFCAFLVYGIDGTTDEVTQLPVVRSEGDDNIFYCYGAPQYSSKDKALVFFETKPTALYAYGDYFAVDGTCLSAIGSAGYDSYITEGQMTYYSTLNGSFEEISEENYYTLVLEQKNLVCSPLP